MKNLSFRKRLEELMEEIEERRWAEGLEQEFKEAIKRGRSEGVAVITKKLHKTK